MSTAELMSALAANRKQFFDLLEALERECSCTIDEMELQAALDSKFDGRTTLTTEEARELLMEVSRPTPRRTGGRG
jgi:hypothetical protein